MAGRPIKAGYTRSQLWDSEFDGGARILLWQEDRAQSTLMRQIRHVSFDLDGTLVDSFDVMRQSWEAATRQLGIECEFEKYRNYVGLPFDKILEKIGLSNRHADLANLYFSGTQAMQDRVMKIEGADELLVACRTRGLSLSVITSKPRRTAFPLLRDLKLDVDFLVCADDVPKGKPDPNSAMLLCDHLCLTPAEVLYVGDTALDYHFAINAGMSFVLFDNNGLHRMPSNLLARVERVTTLSAIAALLP